jgi:type VI secretion system protein ImpE
MSFAATIASLLEDCALDAALETAKEQVKSHPGDKQARHLYIDLLVLKGEYERADAQCNLAANFSPEDATGFGLLRHQLRAMAARNAWFAEGAVPQFPGEPSAREKQMLKLAIARKDGASGEALAILEALDEEGAAPQSEAAGNTLPFLRDADDRTAYVLEALTSGGAYLWVGFERIADLKLEPVTRPRDYAFRPARLTLRDGASAMVLLPAIYHGTPAESALLLARETRWQQDDSGLTTGSGQRCLLVGDDLLPLHELPELQGISHPAGVTADG